MFEDLLKVKTWNAETNGRFLDALNDYFDEDKCKYTAEIAGKLMERGDRANRVSAETLLTYAAAHYTRDGEEAQAPVFFMLGKFHEQNADYATASEWYRKSAATGALGGTAQAALRAALLGSGLTYTDDLRDKLLASGGALDLGLREDRIYEYIGWYLVYEHDGDDELRRKYAERIIGLVRTSEYVPDMLFQKDDIRDKFAAPECVKEFSERLAAEHKAELAAQENEPKA